MILEAYVKLCYSNGYISRKMRFLHPICWYKLQTLIRDLGKEVKLRGTLGSRQNILTAVISAHSATKPGIPSVPSVSLFKRKTRKSSLRYLPFTLEVLELLIVPFTSFPDIH